MSMTIISVLAFFFAIGILVAVHEWGHYIAARMVGVKVLRFSIGFGRALWSRTAGPDQTEYCLAAIPIGGYVKLLDEREGDVDPKEVQRSFNRQPVISRLFILVAGPFMNFVFAVLAYWMMFVVGVPGLIPYVGEVEPDSIAAEAGLEYRDRIVSVGDQPVATWEGAILGIIDGILDTSRLRIETVDVEGNPRVGYLDVSGRVKELTEPGKLFTGLGIQMWSPDFEPVLGELTADGAAQAGGLQTGDRLISASDVQFSGWSEFVKFVQARPDERVAVTIERDGRRQQVELFIGHAQADDGRLIGRIGAGPLVADDFYAQLNAAQRYSPIAAVTVAVERTWSMSALTLRMLVNMVTGRVSVKNISGPINIAQYAGYSAAVGLSSFLNFLAIVSLSLGILNLLPIPILDGGQIVFQLCESIKGRPLSKRVQIVGQQLGVVFLMLIMSFAFYNDLTRVFS